MSRNLNDGLDACMRTSILPANCVPLVESQTHRCAESCMDRIHIWDSIFQHLTASGCDIQNLDCELCLCGRMKYLLLQVIHMSVTTSPVCWVLLGHPLCLLTTLYSVWESGDSLWLSYKEETQDITHFPNSGCERQCICYWLFQGMKVIIEARRGDSRL